MSLGTIWDGMRMKWQHAASIEVAPYRLQELIVIGAFQSTRRLCIVPSLRFFEPS